MSQWLLMGHSFIFFFLLTNYHVSRPDSCVRPSIDLKKSYPPTIQFSLGSVKWKTVVSVEVMKLVDSGVGASVLWYIAHSGVVQLETGI
jgi:hypothetical protein